MSHWDLLPKNIIILIFQYDPTYHNIHKNNLKFLQKEWSIKYIHKNSGSWGWDLCHLIASNRYNFNQCQKICKDLNHKYSTFYHIPDHLQLGDIYDFDKHFFIREYASITSENLKSIDVYPMKWKAFKDKMKKIYKI